jgi:hypothetical protein
MQKVLNNLISYKNEILNLPYTSKDAAFELVWLSRRVADYIYAAELEEQFKKEVPAFMKKQAGNLAASSNTATGKALKEHFETARQAIVTSLSQLIDQLNNISNPLSV